MKYIPICFCILYASIASAQFTSNQSFKIPAKANKLMKDMVLIEGGMFTKGRQEYCSPNEDDTTLLSRSIPIRNTVSDFYLSDHEVTNGEYKEFLIWVQDSVKAMILKDNPNYNMGDKLNPKDFLYDYQIADTHYRLNVYTDTACWTREFQYANMEPMSTYYFRHPAYNNYPVVGVNYMQALAYCHWRSLQLNSFIQKELGYKPDFKLSFRLPSEVEWEYAASNTPPDTKGKSTISDVRIFPWSGFQVMDKKGNYQANFGPIIDKNGFTIKNYMDDNNTYTAAVRSYLPNGFLLYDMAGNVAEWTMDMARVSYNDSLGNISPVNYNDDFATAFRKVYDFTNLYLHKVDSTTQQGRERLVDQTYLYLHDAKVLHINPNARIVKGGSWANGVVYMQCGSREVYSENKSSCRIGFRLAMSVLRRE